MRSELHSLRPAAAVLLALGLGLPGSALADSRQVAVVIGLGSYANLGEEQALPEASATARQLARALEDEAGYQQVLPLVDALATRTAIEDLLLRTLPAQLDGDDHLLIYFVGHGVGADFDDPYLLPYDVDPEDLQGTAISVSQLGASLRNRLDVGSLAILTDAVHNQSLNDLLLLGPHARSWDAITDELFCLSATAPKEVPPPTPFGRLVTDGLRGAAETSGDGQVSAAELYRFVLDQTAAELGNKARPTEAGSYDPGLVLSQVTQSAEAFGDYTDSRPRGGARRIAGGALLGVGVALGAGSLVFFLDGHQLDPYVNDGQRPLPEGASLASMNARYDRDVRWHTALGISAAGFAAVGGTLVFIPTRDTVSVGWSTSF